MRKVIFAEVIILLLLIGVAVHFVLNQSSEDALAATDTSPAAVEKQDPVIKETDPPTEPPTEAPTEPPVVILPIEVEMEDAWAAAIADHTLTARDYFVYDVDLEEFLVISDNVTETSIYPASITKLWAAYVALQYIDPDASVTVGSELSMIDADSSVANLQQGDVLTAEQLVAGMLLPSGNDATYTLAVEVGRILMNNPEMRADWAIERFVYQMNSLAKNKGMTGSSFVTPDGIHDENHYISGQDMLIVAQLALADPILSKYAASFTETVSVSDSRSLTWENSNDLLDPESPYYCSYAVGLKTGYTTPAGNCLLSAFRVDDRELIIGVFGCPVSEDRFADTLLLFTSTCCPED